MTDSTITIKDQASYLRSNNFWIGRSYSENFVKNLYDLASRKVITAEQWNKSGDVSKSWDKQSRSILMLSKIPDQKNVTETEKKSAVLKINGYWIDGKAVGEGVIENLYALYVNGKITPEEWNKLGAATLPWEKQSPAITSLLDKATETTEEQPVHPEETLKEPAPEEEGSSPTQEEQPAQNTPPTVAERKPAPISAEPEPTPPPTVETPAEEPPVPTLTEEAVTEETIPAVVEETVEKKAFPAEPGQKTANGESEMAGMIAIPKELLTEQIRHDFDSDSSEWERRPGANPKDTFSSSFDPNSITFKDGIMTISINKTLSSGAYPFTSGEYRSNKECGYGFYEARMKPGKGNIMAGSFFTYTGSGYGSENQHEIDFEFVTDKETGKMGLETNYYTRGEGAENSSRPNDKQDFAMHSDHKEVIPLDFDPSQGFHTYGFYWKPDGIDFFVDGKLMRTVKEDPKTPTTDIPSEPGKIMMNIWSGAESQSGWLGTYDGKETSTQYDYVRFIPNSDDLGKWFDKNLPRAAESEATAPTPSAPENTEEAPATTATEPITQSESALPAAPAVEDLSAEVHETTEPEKSAKNTLTRWTVAIPLTEKEKKQAPWYNPLNKMGYRLITREERDQLPTLSLSKFLLGWS